MIMSIFKNNISERARSGRNGKQFVYVLDCIENSSAAYDAGKEFESDLDRISFVLDEFRGFDYPSNKRRIPNLQDRLADWLQGLPSNINVEFVTSNIIEIGKSWGYCQTERKTDEFVDNWFNMIALRLLQIAHKVGYNTDSLL